jgi:3-phytase
MNLRALLAAIALAPLCACATVNMGPPPTLVTPFAETAPVGTGEDAADDPAIWVNAANPAASLVFGTDKKAGVYGYDLSGRQVQAIPRGLPNNADLRQQVDMGNGPVDVMGASDRADGTLALFGIDHTTGAAEWRSGTPTQRTEPYGFCMGNDEHGFIAIITYKDGVIQVWRLEGGRPVPKAEWRLSGASESEGCVIDEDNHAVFVSEENVGFWRITYSGVAETGRTLIDRINSGSGLVADVEGATLWRGPNGGGYVIVSSQTADRYMVYDRQAPNALRGSFRIAPSADGAVDGVSHTDGIDATSTPLGPNLPRGLFVAQDDANPGSTQNFKLVDWREIERALNLR